MELMEKGNRMVLIDMEMPERCFDCPCCEIFGVMKECKVLNISLNDLKEKPIICPLKEVQT